MAEGQHRPCAYCGKEFAMNRRGRPRRFCSDLCRERFRPNKVQPTIHCAHCGKLFQRFNAQGTLCSNACKVASHRVRRGGRSVQVRKEITRVRAMPERVRLSLKRARLISAKAADIRRRKHHCCVQCRVKLDGSNLKARYCSDCLVEHRTEWAKAYHKSPVGKRRKRADRALRRARQRGAKSEVFDPIEILSRDGWRCHLCGASTPKRLRGSYHERAPELDHIVPLAKGGSHTRLNAACACRKCNIDKGDRLLGQLRLLA